MSPPIETFEKRPFLPNFGVRGKFLILKILGVFLRLATYLFLELKQKWTFFKGLLIIQMVVRYFEQAPPP